MALKYVTPFGTWLRERLKEKDLTMTQLSNGIGLSESTIYHHIRGKCTPQKSVMKMYAKYFDVDYSVVKDLFENKSQ